MNISAYTDDFDTPDEISRGMSGDVFLDPSRPGETGCCYTCSSMSDNLSWALQDISERKIPVDEITVCYRIGTEQMFRKFTVKDSPIL